MGTIKSESLSTMLKRQTIKKAFSERSEFIIIGLTGDNCRDMADELSKNFSDIECDLYRKFGDGDYNICTTKEEKHVIDYAKLNWKKFDVIKARDVIITYILENPRSFNYFLEDLERATRGKGLYDYKNFLKNDKNEKQVEFYLQYTLNGLERDKDLEDSDFQKGVNKYRESVRYEINLFLKEKTENNETLLERLIKRNKELMEFISGLKGKKFYRKSVSTESDDMSLYVYTKYILPSVGNCIKEILGNEYRRLFQKYGNEIRFYGTLDRSKWKSILDNAKSGGGFDNFYSIAKRINTFIKIRRSPIFSEKSVPVRIVIDSLKNPYEFSFLKDRYSAYYTFGVINKDKIKCSEERYNIDNYENLCEQPEQIKNGFKKFINILVEAASLETNGIITSNDVVEYVNSLKSSTEYMDYIYRKLDIYTENNGDSWEIKKLCPSLKDVKFGSNFEREGISQKEFDFYISLLDDPVRVYCLISNLYPMYLQDKQNAIQNSDVLFSQDNKNRKTYNIVKYVSLIMHPGLVPPTQIERCMQIAFDAKVNSGCICRQVGAVVTDKDYNILSVGWNDVHAHSKVPCIYRSIQDIQDAMKNRTKDEISQIYSDFELDENENFNRYIMQYNLEEDKEHEIMCGVPACYCFKTIYNKVEHKNNPVHSRAIHGEAKAFYNCNRERAKGGYLFTTSSSCENCTMIANEYGIKKIYYIEKYPGIAVEHVNASGSLEDRAEFILFSGVIGEAYTKLYTPVIPLKDELELRGIQELYKGYGFSI